VEEIIKVIIEAEETLLNKINETKLKIIEANHNR